MICGLGLRKNLYLCKLFWRAFLDMKEKIKPFVLPAAIVLGTLTHSYCGLMAAAMPYVIFAILQLTFCAVDIRSLKPTWMDAWLVAFQVIVSVGGYIVMFALTHNPILSEGLLICVLCPVASSTAVVACQLGADRVRVTTYTMIGNLMVAVVAPIVFSFIGINQSMPFIESFWLILKRIASVLAIPFFLALLLQLFLPKVNGVLARWKGAAFYLWACALLITLGQTIDFIFLHGEGNWGSIGWLAVIALVICIIQFGVGKLLGRHYGDIMAGGQLLGQKNSAMGIWMSNTYLTPLASCVLAFYSIYQNLFNSWQIWKHSNP